MKHKCVSLSKTVDSSEFVRWLLQWPSLRWAASDNCSGWPTPFAHLLLHHLFSTFLFFLFFSFSCSSFHHFSLLNFSLTYRLPLYFSEYSEQAIDSCCCCNCCCCCYFSIHLSLSFCFCCTLIWHTSFFFFFFFLINSLFSFHPSFFRFLSSLSGFSRFLWFLFIILDGFYYCTFAIILFLFFTKEVYADFRKNELPNF